MTHLVVYGDFNCPFSRLASARLARLEAAGEVAADVRVVEHDRGIPTAGVAVAGAVAEELGKELDQIRQMLGPDEPDPLRLPSRRVNTGLAVDAYAAASPQDRPRLREQIFAAYWEDDRPIDDPAVLAELGAPGSDGETVERWRAEWLGLPNQTVPVMILPDGYVSNGLGVLTRLVELTGAG